MASNKAWAGVMIVGTCVMAQMGGALSAVLIAAAGAICVKKLIVSWHTDTTNAIYQDKEQQVWSKLDPIQDERKRRAMEREVRKDIACLREEQRKHPQQIAKLADGFAWGVFAFPFALIVGAGYAAARVLQTHVRETKEAKQQKAAT